MTLISSLVGFSRSIHMRVPSSRRAAEIASGEASRLIRPSRWRMNAFTISCTVSGMSDFDPTRTEPPTEPKEAAPSLDPSVDPPIDPASHLEHPLQVDISRHAETEAPEPESPPEVAQESGPYPGHLQLPHSAHCLVCGRDNPQGLKLDLFVDPDTGIVRSEFLPTQNHTGFAGVVHGGAIATVLD